MMKARCKKNICWMPLLYTGHTWLCSLKEIQEGFRRNNRECGSVVKGEGTQWPALEDTNFLCEFLFIPIYRKGKGCPLGLQHSPSDSEPG
jgi:hypothetical protein